MSKEKLPETKGELVVPYTFDRKEFYKMHVNNAAAKIVDSLQDMEQTLAMLLGEEALVYDPYIALTTQIRLTRREAQLLFDLATRLKLRPLT